MRKRYYWAWATLLLLNTVAMAAGPAIQQHFNQRYQDYFRPDSKSLLPLPEMKKTEWTKLRSSRDLIKVFSEPGKYYNSKIYTFTLYQSADDGSYYLDATGGFWGMDQLIYGPLSATDLE